MESFDGRIPEVGWFGTNCSFSVHRKKEVGFVHLSWVQDKNAPAIQLVKKDRTMVAVRVACSCACYEKATHQKRGSLLRCLAMVDTFGFDSGLF